MSMKFTVAATALLIAIPATAQDQNEDPTMVDVAAWDFEYLYDGWSALELLDEEAYGADEQVVGEVEDLIIGPDGAIQKVVIEGGGFLDIGDSHIAIPWEEVVRRGTNAVATPVTDGNLDNYGMFERVDDLPPEPENFRLSALLGSYVRADGVGYGDVRDVIFTQDDVIEAVIIYPAFGYGYGTRPVAVPYASQTYAPHSAYYDVPYTTQSLSDLRPFEYGRVQ